ncbi:MAG TPA: PAS domain S-box protein, partial [Flavisolibacter sp.]|nr:PAS domain S-box protein [Flavisolibacter sp.]
MQPLKKLVRITVFVVLIALLFNLFGYYYSSYKTEANSQREEAERLSIDQMALSQDVSRDMNLLLTHTQFDDEQYRDLRLRLQASLELFSRQHSLLLQMAGTHISLAELGPGLTELNMYTINIRQLGESLVGGQRLQDSAAAIQVLHASDAEMTRGLKKLISELRKMQADLEGSISIMNKAVLFSLLATLGFLLVVVVTPVFRQSVKNYQDLQQSMAEIRRSEQLLRTIIDAMPDRIFLQDTENRFLMVNRAMAKMVNEDPEFFIGRNDLEVGIPKELVLGDPDRGIKGFWPANREVISSGQTQHIAVEPMVIKGEQHFISTTRVPLRHADGTTWGLLGFLHDITSRIRSEEQLRHSEENYRYLFQSNPLPMWIFDLQTGGFLEVNQMAIQHYGYTAGEFAKMTIYDIRPASELKRLEEIMKEKREENIAYERGVWTHVKKNKDSIYVQIISHKIRYKDEDAMLVLAHDVTENIRLHHRLVKEKIARQKEIAMATIDVQERERNEIGRELHDNVNQILTSAKLNLEFMENESADKERH